MNMHYQLTDVTLGENIEFDAENVDAALAHVFDVRHLSWADMPMTARVLKIGAWANRSTWTIFATYENNEQLYVLWTLP